MRTPDRQQVAAALAIDAVAVVLFVAIGRRSHDEGNAATELVRTALPFLIGLAAGWGVTRAWRRPMSVLTGVAVWPVTILVGMLARRWLFDRGTAASFVVVATLFVGACLVGWRALAAIIRRRRGTVAAVSAS
jgi:peptidoglycan/LPS O-acetylase OafA/YrhL